MYNVKKQKNKTKAATLMSYSLHSSNTVPSFQYCDLFSFVKHWHILQCRIDKATENSIKYHKKKKIIQNLLNWTFPNLGRLTDAVNVKDIYDVSGYVQNTISNCKGFYKCAQSCKWNQQLHIICKLSGTEHATSKNPFTNRPLQSATMFWAIWMTGSAFSLGVHFFALVSDLTI